MSPRLVTNLAIPFLVLLATGRAQTPIVSAKGETMRIRSSQVNGSGNSWTITLTMDDDNGNRALPTTYRRWWHVQIGNLNPNATTTLAMRVSNAGYSDIILPVWSHSVDRGKTFGSHTRVPTSATPTYSSSTHRFTLVVPAGVTDIRLAKYFPFTIADRNRLIARVRTHSHVRSTASLGTTVGGRSIPMLEITNGTVPDKDKRRVWVHAGIHPAETTSYFVVEGLVDWLLSGSWQAEFALRHLIFDIVPMANPDGVHAGNYRTNGRSVNLEEQWAAPYNSTEREIVAMRAKIEQFMGTTSRPGANPIELLLNLHSSHNVSYPFHFQHKSNPNFNLTTNNSGVIPSVNAKEGKWIASFRGRSAFVRLGTTASSSAGAPRRPFVESMMHDRWSIDPKWTGAPNLEQEIMAITFEGTYRRGPDRVTWNTTTDYARVGREMGEAIADYFGVRSGVSILGYGPECGAKIYVSFSTAPDRVHLSTIGRANDPVWLVLGATRKVTPLPFSSCSLLTETAIVLGGMRYDAYGSVINTYPLPTIPGFAFKAQFVAADLRSSSLKLYATSALDVLFAR